MIIKETWREIRAEAQRQATAEPVLASFIQSHILDHASFEQAVGWVVAEKLACQWLDASTLRAMFAEAAKQKAAIANVACEDLLCIRSRDPACTNLATPLLYLKGFHALQAYRLAHWLWNGNRRSLAFLIQSKMAMAFGVDIHPAARIGRGIMLDHATGIVIGETAVVEDNVSMLHEVTLGGTGKVSGDRHPKIRRGVMIGAGAKILGNIIIGEGAKVGAGSVVLQDVPPHCTVAGVPARIIGHPKSDQPALEMDQSFPSAE